MQIPSVQYVLMYSGSGVVGGDTRQSSLHSDTLADGAIVEVVLDSGPSGTEEKRGKVPRGRLG